MKMSENINETTRHLKFQFLQISYGRTDIYIYLTVLIILLVGFHVHFWLVLSEIVQLKGSSGLTPPLPHPLRRRA